MTWGKGALLALVVLEIVVVTTGRASLGQAAALLVAVEVIVALVVLASIALKARRGAGPVLDRVQRGLEGVMPSVAAAAVVGEFRLMRAAVLAVSRRVERRHPTDEIIPYAAGRLFLPVVLGVVSVIELIVVDVLIPWHLLGPAVWLRWILLAVSVYGVFWIVGWCAAERTRPHLVTERGLLLRTATTDVADIPWDAIESVTVRKALSRDESRLNLDAPMTPPNLDIDLTRPVATRRFVKPGPPSATFSVSVDDPESARVLLIARSARAVPDDGSIPTRGDRDR